MVAISVMISLATVLALPIISLILSHAAAVLVQRESGLNLLEAHDLPDEDWAEASQTTRKSFLTGGFALILLS
jgi:hypothetical protein